MDKRFKVTEPVDGGYAYYNVVDTHHPNAPYPACIFRYTPCAAKFAEDICAALNGRVDAK